MGARHLSVATAIEKNRLFSDVAFVVLLEIDIKNEIGEHVEWLRLARNTENLIFQGEVYQAANFDVDLVEDIEEQPRLTIEAHDPTDLIRSRMEMYSGGGGFVCTMYVVNTGNLDQAAEVQETFIVKVGSASGHRVKFILGIENPLTRRFPHRMQFRDQCPFIFKGPRCKYAGGATLCDYTFDGIDGCKAKGNQANYGGFRGIQGFQ